MRNAVRQFSKIPVRVEWKPFQIDPGTDVQGERVETYCRRRWGSSGWTSHLRREGEKSGASFSDWRFWPNTLKGHQFILYGVERHDAPTDRMNSILFDATYEQGKNVSLTETLVDLAQCHFPDWDRNDLRQFLEEDRGGARVHTEIATGRRQYGVSAVPFFVIGVADSNGRYRDGAHKPYGLSGAQPVDAFLDVFAQVVDEVDVHEE